MTIWLWIGFITLILALLALDLGVLNRKAHVIGTREALAWTAFWIVLALLFNGAMYYMYEHHWLGIGLHKGGEESGADAALKYFTGYVVEKSLSLDNIFVIAVIFNYFSVPDLFQHRVLFWGILGALILRGAMIAAGAALVHRFHWVIYIFGALLIVTAIKMILSKEDSPHPDRNPFVRLARRFYPVTPDFEGKHFFSRVDGKRAITPLFLVLLVVESTDVLFAIDSIPAIFAITTDPFIIFTSNVFAILGLRSLYFALASVIDKFRFLKVSLMLVLIYVGLKMLLSGFVTVPASISLAVIVGILFTGIVTSIVVASHASGGKPRSTNP